jgi:RNA polymerase sigma-70 factor, ECF subfamily
MNQELEERIGELLDRQDYNGALTLAEQGYGPGILGYLHSMARCPTDADDAYGDFQLALVKGIRAFERRCLFRTYAYTIARNAMCKVAKAHRPLGSPVGSSVPDPKSSRKAWQRTSALAQLERLRALLTDEERELFVLRVDREMPFSEIALVLSSGTPHGMISEAACKQRFLRLKDKLSKLHQEIG